MGYLETLYQETKAPRGAEHTIVVRMSDRYEVHYWFPIFIDMVRRTEELDKEFDEAASRGEIRIVSLEEWKVIRERGF